MVNELDLIMDRSEESEFKSWLKQSLTRTPYYQSTFSWKTESKGQPDALKLLHMVWEGVPPFWRVQKKKEDEIVQVFSA